MSEITKINYSTPALHVAKSSSTDNKFLVTKQKNISEKITHTVSVLLECCDPHRLVLLNGVTYTGLLCFYVDQCHLMA